MSLSVYTVRHSSYLNFSEILKITTEPFGKGRVETESILFIPKKGFILTQNLFSLYNHTYTLLCNLVFRKY